MDVPKIVKISAEPRTTTGQKQSHKKKSKLATTENSENIHNKENKKTEQIIKSSTISLIQGKGDEMIFLKTSPEGTIKTIYVD